MSESMEVLGIGGHEAFAESMFMKLKDIMGTSDLEIVELTKQQYDALTPQEKADPNKLYLVDGDGSYLKFVEISAEEYEALTDEEKYDPSVVYMTPGTGTYFRVIDISQEDYDELTEEEKLNPNNLYLIQDDTEYLTTTDAASTYLSKTDASSTYGTKTEVADADVIDGSDTAVSSYEFVDDGGNVPFSSIIFEFESEQKGSGTPSPSNIRNFVGITGVEISIAPDDSSSDNVVTCMFGNKQYSGTYDAISGKLTLNKEVVTLDGTESIDRYEKVAPTIGTVYYVYEYFIGAGHEETDEDNTNTKCSHYRVDSNIEPLVDNLVTYVNGSNRVVWKHDSIATVSDMQTQLATWYANGTPLQYEATLVAPKVLYINPADIKTLKGNNYVTAKILYDDSTDEDADFKIEVLKSKLSAPMSWMANKKVIVNLTWDSTNNWYTSDKLLIGHTNLYPNAIINLVLEQGYDAEFQINTGDDTSLPNYKHRRLLIPFDYHRNDTNIVNSYILFYSYDAGATTGLTLKRYRAQYVSAEDMYVIKEESI